MGAQTQPQFDRFFEQHGLERLERLLIQLAHGFAPEPIRPEFVNKRSPYVNPASHTKAMEDMVERGWFQVVVGDSYRLTAKGQEVAQGMSDLFGETHGSLEPLPEADMARIAALLLPVVEEARALPEPADKWALSWGLKFDRGPSAPLTIQVRRRLIDLTAFRDDAHIAAWRPYGVSGQAWEALTYVWRGEAGTAADLAEQLSSRDYDEASYAAALQDLARRGWIAEEDSAYMVTEEGKALRQEAEDTTDRYFDAPWAVLSGTELAEVKGLLERLAAAVKTEE
jgi:Mn-dependent DtxR family transcriptional regulator